ncbi:hypothetical protein HKX48_002512 [Thoreauomyces humboldtii]|nr:hypothetical protein HKX48_002512 [Thoreauomyces humboldtii]
MAQNTTIEAPGVPTNPGAPGSSISYVALILGLCAAFGLGALIVGWIMWRRRVRARPDFERRKIQRTRGMSAITGRARRTWHEGVDTIHASLSRGGSRVKFSLPRHNAPATDAPPLDGSDPRKAISTPARMPRPCFRPSTDVLPPKLCRTFTWQDESEILTEDPEPPSFTAPPSPIYPDREGLDGVAKAAEDAGKDARSVRSGKAGWDVDDELCLSNM